MVETQLTTSQFVNMSLKARFNKQYILLIYIVFFLNQSGTVDTIVMFKFFLSFPTVKVAEYSKKTKQKQKCFKSKGHTGDQSSLDSSPKKPTPGVKKSARPHATRHKTRKDRNFCTLLKLISQKTICFMFFFSLFPELSVCRGDAERMFQRPPVGGSWRAARSPSACPSCVRRSATFTARARRLNKYIWRPRMGRLMWGRGAGLLGEGGVAALTARRSLGRVGSSRLPRS